MLEYNHYDHIPAYTFKKSGNTILDVGCMDANSATASIHGEIFQKADAQDAYLGIDIQEYDPHYLKNIIRGDIFDFDTQRKFNLILALHVLEHIPFDKWSTIFEKLKGLTSPNGYLVIEVPHRERPKRYRKAYQKYGHCVFDIDESLLREFIPDLIFLHRTEKRTYRHFRIPDEGLLRPIVRFIVRIVTLHEHSYFRHIGTVQMLTAIWKKAGVE